MRKILPYLAVAICVYTVAVPIFLACSGKGEIYLEDIEEEEALCRTECDTYLVDSGLSTLGATCSYIEYADLSGSTDAVFVTGLGGAANFTDWVYDGGFACVVEMPEIEEGSQCYCTVDREVCKHDADESDAPAWPTLSPDQKARSGSQHASGPVKLGKNHWSIPRSYIVAKLVKPKSRQRGEHLYHHRF